MKTLISLIVMLLAVPTAAQTTVSQGSGSTNVTEWKMDQSARRAGDTSEVLVTNAAGGTIIPAFTGRKAIEIQNLGPNAIYCTVDGGAPVVGSHGRKIATDSVWSLDAGPAIVIKCIAATAAQLTTAATIVTQLR